MKQISIILTCLLAAGCETTRPAQAGPSDQNPKNPSHLFSRMEFPDTVAAFRRGKAHRYDAEGRDLSVAYNLARLGSAVAGTVYVYPAPIDVAVFPVPKVGESPEWFVTNHFEQVKAQILSHHRDATVVSEGDAFVEQNHKREKGKRALLSYPDSTPYGVQPFLSEMYLFTHGKWFIKYRFTYLRDYETVVRTDIDTFMKELKWP